MNLETLGDRLKQLRKHLNMTQIEMAAKFDVHQNAISRLEKGKGADVGLLINILEFFSQHYSMDYLFSSKFDLINYEMDKGTAHEILAQKLKMLKKEISTSVDNIIDDYLDVE